MDACFQREWTKWHGPWQWFTLIIWTITTCAIVQALEEGTTVFGYNWTVILIPVMIWVGCLVVRLFPCCCERCLRYDCTPNVPLIVKLYGILVLVLIIIYMALLANNLNHISNRREYMSWWNVFAPILALIITFWIRAFLLTCIPSTRLRSTSGILNGFGCISDSTHDPDTYKNAIDHYPRAKFEDYANPQNLEEA